MWMWFLSSSLAPGLAWDAGQKWSHLALPPLTACDIQASSLIWLSLHFLFPQVKMTAAPCLS